MRSLGQLCLLAALVCSAYASFVSLGYRAGRHPWLARLGTLGGVLALMFLSAVMGILAWALWQRDFSIDYVARYSSNQLPWQYALSALWVGQAGSLLLWAWMLAGLALVFRFISGPDTVLRQSAFGILMGCLAFLAALLVFAADPLKASVSAPSEGLGLSPLLQHPSMLIHPPVVFFAYAAWTMPFALAISALLHGRLDATWTEMARPWALLGWLTLGIGLLLGAHWAYQELGWGGYWGWDPVENGSLLPWLTGTALIHGLMAWRHRDSLKRSAVALAIFTFGLCNFATFLTRSGLFSSVHAFSESPLGWAFLALMGLLLIGGLSLVLVRWSALAPRRHPKSILARESLVLVSTSLLVILALIILGSTLVPPLSMVFSGHTIMVGPSFYNQVLVPIGLLLLTTTAAVPLLRWGEGPGPAQRRLLWACLALGVATAGVSLVLGVRHPIALAVAGLAAFAVGCLVAGLWLELRRRQSSNLGLSLVQLLGNQRRQYAGYLVHLGFLILAIGITGSALGHRRHEIEMSEGETTVWADRHIHYQELVQREESDKLVAEAILELAGPGQTPMLLRPARHFHLLQNEWTSEVAIHSTWSGDFYTVLDAGLGDGKVALTFVDNPMMRWIWCGGMIACLGALAAMWPGRRGRLQASHAKEPADPAETVEEMPQRFAA